jgi:polysaccharide pyruvyl transferase WcaK-like protein
MNVQNRERIINVLHLGFFFRNNLGDDMFIEAFKELYSFSEESINVHFECLDDVKTWSVERFSKYNLIAIGGGDIVNDYFCDTIMMIKKELMQSKITLPIVFIGAGIPHPSFLSGNKVFAIDKIGLRNKTDSRKIQQMFGTKNVIFAPDFGFMYNYDKNLKEKFGVSRKLNVQWREKFTGTEGKVLKIGMCMAQPVNAILPEYSTKIANLIDILTSEEYTRALKEVHGIPCIGVEVVLIPFNISPKNKSESDIILNREIIEKAKNHMNVISVSDSDIPTVEHCIQIFENVDLLVCHRFHAHVFSICARRPFVSVNFSRKVQLLLKEERIPEFAITNSTVVSAYSEVEKKDVKTLNFDEQAISEKILNLFANKCEKLSILQDCIDSSRVKNELFFTPDVRKSLCKFITDDSVILSQDQNRRNACFGDGRKRWDEIADYILSLHRRGKGVEYLAEVLCFKATGGTPGSKYLWGTTDNIKAQIRKCDTPDMLRKKLSDMAEFIEKNERRENELASRAEMNLTYINQDSMKGLHRSGWSYCINGLKSAWGNSKDGIYVDMYLDKTFGWALASMSDSGTIPYLGPWAGFFHHTPSSRFGNRSLEAVFNEPLFRSSLNSCVSLFCLSEYLAVWVRERLVQLRDVDNVLGADPALVFVVHHPTEFVEKTFDVTTLSAALEGGSFVPTVKYLEAKAQITSSPIARFPAASKEGNAIRLVGVGAWYRNPVSIYRLFQQIPENFFLFRLKGRGMENYFPNKGDKITKACLSSSSVNRVSSQFMITLNELIYNNLVTKTQKDRVFDEAREHFSECPSNFSISVISNGEENYTNPFVRSLGSAIHQMINSVSILEYLPNDEYDSLLETCVPFIDFVDCSAANTIIECSTRNTPIVTNRHPAVEEYLGKDYPLLFDKIEDITEEWLTPQRIASGHEYIKNLNKDRLKLPTFVSEVHASVEKRLTQF